MNITSRRRFLQWLGVMSGTVLAGGRPVFGAEETGASAAGGGKSEGTFSSRPSGSKYMGNFVAPKIKTVRIAFIGVGDRGSSHLAQMCIIEGSGSVEIVAIADNFKANALRGQGVVKEKTGRDIPAYFEGDFDYKRMLSEVKPDAVIISTPWNLHCPMAIDAMEAGSHAFVEVPLGCTTEELWKVVDTSEKTQKYCMLMENCNYGREELMYLNMVRQGVIGELLHAEAAYLHELRFQMKDHQEHGTGSWRTLEWAQRNGNLYPTHGLGPVAQYMNLARQDDNFRRLVSFSSPSKGHAAYAKKHFAADHKWNKLEYKGGDMNTSIIKTVLGRTIMIQWDETSPRPYSRHDLITGVKGTLAGFPTRVAGENLILLKNSDGSKTLVNPSASDFNEDIASKANGGKEINMSGAYHKWIQEKEDLEIVYAKYDHPLYKRLGELSSKIGGHGGMDYIMLVRIIECLNKGEQLDQNLYEGAFWSAVTPLSEKSVAEDGMPQDFPDFTRGDWKTTKPLAIVS